MDVTGDRSPIFIAWLIVVGLVCDAEATAAQGPPDPVPGPAEVQTKRDVRDVGGEKSLTFLLPIERGLQRISRRTAGDRTLKPLADATIRRRDYTDAKGKPTAYWLNIGAPTDDQIEISTNGNPGSIKVAGNVGVSVDYDAIEGDGVEANETLLSGLHNGVVSWRTNNPKILVTISWFTRDSDAPDRLLAIVREELEREGLRLLPMSKTEWPAATTSERLSRLLPLDSAPSVAPQSKAVATSPQEPAIGFASPYDVVAASNQAVANKDWQAYARCLTPAAQGSLIGEVLSLVDEGGEKCPELIKTIEAHLKFKLFDEIVPQGASVQSKKAREFFEPLGNPPGEDAEAADARLYEVFRKRVGEVPAFLADCFRQLPGPPEGIGKPVECEGIRIAGDKASGYRIDRRPAPAPEEVETHGRTYYLPRYFPVRFRRIEGSWLID